MDRTRAVGYVRISKDRDEESSTETQEASIRAYCAAHGWDVVDVLVEPGRSAFKASRSNRPKFRKARQLIDAGAANALVVWKIDRACRDAEDTLRLVREFRNIGARFVSVTESFDSATPTGKMMVTMLSGLAEMESATKSERQAAWHDHRRATGKTPTGPRPYGYRRERNRLLVDGGEAKVIRDAAKKVIAGASLRSIVGGLDDKGVIGKSGKPLSQRALRFILLSPTIAAVREVAPGKFVQSDEWKPILDRETWDRVRDVLMDPARLTNPGNTRRWLLSGIATCGRCEDSVTLKCHGHKTGPRYVCPQCLLSIEQARTDEEVVTALLEMLNAKKWRRLRQGAPTKGVGTVEFEQAMSELTDSFVAGDIDAAELASTAEELRRQLETTAMPSTSLPDVPDIAKAWAKDEREVGGLSLEQRRLVLSTATKSLTIKPWARTRGFDRRRVVWEPIS
jgi:DNA invertase Pin-like site-specific DNA recombinase